MIPRRNYLRGPGEPPRIIGHRGLPARAPENTIASIRAALDVNVPMVEVDVHLTADDQVVAIHDRTLQRTTTGNGAVRSYTLEELSGVDAGSWFDPVFADQRVPTLQQVLSLVCPAAELNLEIKSYPFHRIDPDHLATTVLACIGDERLLDTVLFTSFDSEVLSAIRRHKPGVSIGLLQSRIRNLFRDPLDMARHLEATAFICAKRDFRPSYLEAAHALGMSVFVYTVNDQSEAGRLADTGADGLITDVADTLMRIIA